MTEVKILEGGAYAEWNQLTNGYREEGRNEMILYINRKKEEEEDSKHLKLKPTS